MMDLLIKKRYFLQKTFWTDIMDFYAEPSNQEFCRLKSVDFRTEIVEFYEGERKLDSLTIWSEILEFYEKLSLQES